MSKRLVVTRADDHIEEMVKLTHPGLKRYAKFCDADFKILSDSKDLHPHYRILQIHDLFKEYDRIAVIDTDVLIMKTCSSIFDEVPRGYIGSIFEDKGSRLTDRRRRIKAVQKQFTKIGWVEGYINTGVCLFEKMHQPIFAYKEGQQLWDQLGYDDIYLMYMAQFFKFPVHELDYSWNFMSIFEEAWFNKKRYIDAKIIHYAGKAFYPQIPRIEQMKQDKLLLIRHNKLI